MPPPANGFSSCLPVDVGVHEVARLFDAARRRRRVATERPVTTESSTHLEDIWITPDQTFRDICPIRRLVDSLILDLNVAEHHRYPRPLSRGRERPRGARGAPRAGLSYGASREHGDRPRLLRREGLARMDERPL